MANTAPNSFCHKIPLVSRTHNVKAHVDPILEPSRHLARIPRLVTQACITHVLAVLCFGFGAAPGAALVSAFDIASRHPCDRSSTWVPFQIDPLPGQRQQVLPTCPTEFCTGQGNFRIVVLSGCGAILLLASPPTSANEREHLTAFARRPQAPRVKCKAATGTGFRNQA